MATRKKSIAAICIVLIAIAMIAAAVVWLVPRSVFLAAMFEHESPGLIPTSSFVRNLSSDDPDLVRESLSFLAARKDPAGVTVALTLLQSKDDYIWLNAALYTGACGRQEAIPYLIKALRHTAWRADSDTLATLKTLTGQNLGNAFAPWQAWWMSQHPDPSFDWTSHLGFSPRAPATQQN